MFEIELYPFIFLVLGEMGWPKCMPVRVDVGVFTSLGRMLDMMPANILSNYIFKIRIWIFMEAFLRLYKTEYYNV